MECMDREQMREIQSIRLRKMADYVYHNTPFYRKKFQEMGLEPGDIKSIDDIVKGFTFHSNRTELFNLRPCALRQRIIDVFGKKLNQDLLPLEVETTVCKIHGFVGKPESAKKKGAFLRRWRWRS